MVLERPPDVDRCIIQNSPAKLKIGFEHLRRADVTLTKTKTWLFWENAITTFFFSFYGKIRFGYDKCGLKQKTAGAFKVKFKTKGPVETAFPQKLDGIGEVNFIRPCNNIYFKQRTLLLSSTIF